MEKKFFAKRFFSKVKKHSLTAGLWSVIATALLVFGVAFLAATFIMTSESRRTSEVRESETIINAVAASIKSGIDNHKDFSRLVMINEKVVEFLNAKEVDPGIMNDTKYEIMDVLNVSTYLDSVFVFRNDREYINTGRGEYNMNTELMYEGDWYRNIHDARGGAVIYMDANGALYRHNGDHIITIARDIYDIYTQDRIGLLLLNISLKMFDRIVYGHPNEEIAILTSGGIFLSGNEELAALYEKPGERGVITHETVGFLGRDMISEYFFEDMPIIIMCRNTAKTARITWGTAIVLLMLLLAYVSAILISGFFISKNINRPIYELSAAMDKTKESGYLEKIDVAMPQNEIGNLAENYNAMIVSLNDLFTKLLEKEKSVQRAEMRVLHEQIKPHFLYNSIETIGFLAMDAGAPQVYNALETLGSFYRNFLSKGDREITIKREVSIIKDYLSLQKLRYGDIINDEYVIEEDTLELKIPKLILQPLVENCIYHGIRPKGEPGIIRVSTCMDDGNVIISVYDNGVGMSEEMMKTVLESEKSDETVESESPLSGFGLKGTIERIRYYCDNRDVVRIESVMGEYTRITLSIPVMNKE